MDKRIRILYCEIKSNAITYDLKQSINNEGMSKYDI